jgi:hypothetical protein
VRRKKGTFLHAFVKIGVEKLVGFGVFPKYQGFAGRGKNL